MISKRVTIHIISLFKIHIRQTLQYFGFMKRTISKQERKFIKASSISQCLKCSVCMEPFHEPTRLFCGHTFCWKCIEMWSKTHSNCPICRLKIDSANIGKDLLAFNVINEMEVFCCYEDCSWKGALEVLEIHVNYDCIYDQLAREKQIKKPTANANKTTSLEQSVDEEVMQKINQNTSRGNLLSRVMMKDNKLGKTFDVARKLIRAQTNREKQISQSESKGCKKPKKQELNQQQKKPKQSKSQAAIDDLDYLLQLYDSK